MKRILLLVFVAGFILAVVKLPLPIPADQDFQFLYHVDLGLRQGIPVYDYAALTRMIAATEGLAASKVNVPYAYPPWYALATLPLAFLVPTEAARLWFILNLAMFMGAVWLLTDTWPARKRLTAVLAASLFLPVAGGIFVGQYDFPILLGAAMLSYGLSRQKAGIVALAFALLTFKPHIGIFILMAGLFYLISRRDDFSRQALRLTAFVGLFLFAVGFAASRFWPLDYLRSLVSFKQTRQCIDCTSLPTAITNPLSGSFNNAIAIALLFLLLAIALLLWKRHILVGEPRLLVAACALATLMVSPYLHNYDYVLLLVPMLTIAGEARGMDWLWLAVAVLLPLPGFLIPGFEGQFTLIVSTLIVFILFVRMIHRRESAPSQAVGQIAG